MVSPPTASADLDKDGKPLPLLSRSTMDPAANLGGAFDMSRAFLTPGMEVGPAGESDTSAAGKPKTEILAVTLHEAQGLRFLQGSHDRVSGKHRPYALVDFDKTQVLIRTVDGTPENPLWAANVEYKFDVTRAAELTVQVFSRNPDAAADSGQASDISLGVAYLDPQFDGDTTPENAAAKWVDMTNGTGRLLLGLRYAENPASAGGLSIADFELLKVVGKGSFGNMMQVRKKDTDRIYAMKSISKAKLAHPTEAAHTLAERSALAQIDNPFIVPLKFTFQSSAKVYLVMPFIHGGELFHHLSKEGRSDINSCRFYAAELICALECLHSSNIIYGGLKPDNILLDYHGHISLCGFGSCKLMAKNEGRTCPGSDKYLAPEMLLGQEYDMAADWWTLGVLLYQMLTSHPPFHDEDPREMHRKVISEPLHFRGQSISPAAKDLIFKLLDQNPAKRLGANGAAEVKSHPFFRGIDWAKVLHRVYEPAFKPNVNRPRDPGCTYDGCPFPGELSDPADYVDGPVLSQSLQDQFKGFTYNRPTAGLETAASNVAANAKNPL